MAKLSTNLIHGHEHKDAYGSHIPPIYTGVIYEYIDIERNLAVLIDRGNYLRYGREENPTTRALERIVSKLENTEEALAFNSGMAAISTTFLYFLKPGDKIVMPMELYSSTFALFNNISSKLNIKVEKVWPSAEAIANSADEKTSMVFIEVMTNPTNKVIDIEYLSKNLDLNKTILVVDNTFTTPLLLKPAKYGARLVIHSMTKYFSGHNDVVGGVIAGSKDDIKSLWDWRRILGGILQPFDSYMVLRGLKTLEVRFEKQSSNAKAIAEYLAENPRVECVMYPGLSKDPYNQIAKRLFERPLFGGVLSFRLKGTYDDTLRFISKLQIIKRTPSLGGTESMAVIPSKAASMFIDPEHRPLLGITDNLVRLSIGLEDVDDLIEDLSQALNF
ncbi:MAG: cystathionine gamma-synthase family protein [Sulfolobales archaeon]